MTRQIRTETTKLNQCAVLAMLLCLPAASDLGVRSDANANEIERNLNATFQGRILILRNFYRGPRLRFDQSGDLRKGGPLGSWTVAGKVEVEKIRVKNQLLRIEGKRVLLVYDQDRKRFRNVRGNPVVIEMELPQDPRTAEALNPVLKKVFLAAGEQVCDIVPDHWKTYCIGEQDPDRSFQDVEKLKDALRSQWQDGTPPTSVFRPWPPYSDEARQAGVGGVTVLLVSVDAQGNVTGVRVVTPLGMGLDDQAVETIKTWKYQPATQRGVPVAVRVMVEIEFRTSGR